MGFWRPCGVAEDRIAVQPVSQSSRCRAPQPPLVPDHADINVALAEQEIVADVPPSKRQRPPAHDKLLLSDRDGVNDVHHCKPIVVRRPLRKRKDDRDGIRATRRDAAQCRLDLAVALAAEWANIARRCDDNALDLRRGRSTHRERNCENKTKPCGSNANTVPSHDFPPEWRFTHVCAWRWSGQHPPSALLRLNCRGGPAIEQTANYHFSCSSPRWMIAHSSRLAGVRGSSRQLLISSA